MKKKWLLILFVIALSPLYSKGDIKEIKPVQSTVDNEITQTNDSDEETLTDEELEKEMDTRIYSEGEDEGEDNPDDITNTDTGAEEDDTEDN